MTWPNRGGGDGGGAVDSVGVTSPLTNTGTPTDPVLAIPAATTAQPGYMTTAQISTLTAALITDPATGVTTVPGAATLNGASSAAYNDIVGLRTPGIGITVPTVSSRQTLSRFDLATNTQPAGASDQTGDVPQFGTSSVRFLIGNGATTNLFPKNAVSYSAAAVDVTDKYVTLRIKQIFVASSSIELANVGSIQVRLHNEATPNTASANYLRAFCGKAANGDRMTGLWQNIRIPIEEFGVVGTITDVAAFKQQIRYASVSINHVGTTSDTLRFGIASITVEPKLATKGMCILSFDDCRLDTFTYAAALMARYGFVGVLYPGAFREDLGKDAANKMNIAQLQALVAQGWQVGSQAWDTEAPGYSVAAMAGAMSAEHNYMLSLGLKGSVDGSYFSNVGPNGVYQTVFDQAFRTMRDYMQFNDAQTPRPETCPPSERQMLKCYGVFTTTNSATNGLIPYAQKAAAQKGCAIYSWHALASSDTKIAADGGTLTSFEKFTEWLDLNRDIIEVVTMDTYVRRMAGPQADAYPGVIQLANNATVKTANYTVGATDSLIRVDATSGNLTVTLPSAAAAYASGIGKVFSVKKMDFGVNTVTVSGATIDGAASVVLSSQYSSITVQSNGTTYDIVGKV